MAKRAAGNLVDHYFGRRASGNQLTRVCSKVSGALHVGSGNNLAATSFSTTTNSLAVAAYVAFVGVGAAAAVAATTIPLPQKRERVEEFCVCERIRMLTLSHTHTLSRIEHPLAGLVQFRRP